uniref:SKP1 component dimerisation domain-containing protein n=1 Tax=Oryza barthii TaxID=65489 RepID=A0A0D3H6R5_9ORYZ
MVMAMAMEAAPAPVPLPLVLRFRNGEDRFALTDQPRQLPLGYAIDAPSIRSARTFGLLDEYARVHAQHARGGPGAVPDIAAWDRAFMEREFTATDELHDLFMHRHLSNLFHRKMLHIILVMADVPIEYFLAWNHACSQAASTLEMDGLSVLCAQKTADVVKKRTVEEVKALLGIADVGMTPEEELKLQHDNDAILCLH